MSFTPPDRLIRQDLLPQPALYSIDGDEVVIRHGSDEERLQLADEPVLAALVLPFRATLAGDVDALKAAFELTVEGDQHAWRMLLTPRQTRVAAVVSQIVLQGGDGQLEGVTIEERNGDRTVMRLTPSPS